MYSEVTITVVLFTTLKIFFKLNASVASMLVICFLGCKYSGSSFCSPVCEGNLCYWYRRDFPHLIWPRRSDLCIPCLCYRTLNVKVQQTFKSNLQHFRIPRESEMLRFKCFDMRDSANSASRRGCFFPLHLYFVAQPLLTPAFFVLQRLQEG